MKLTRRGELAQRASAVQQRLETLNDGIKLAIKANWEANGLNANTPILERLQYRVIALSNAAMNPSGLGEAIGIERGCAHLEKFFQRIKPRSTREFGRALPEPSGPIISGFRREALRLEARLDGLTQKIKSHVAENKLEGDKNCAALYQNLNALFEEGVGLFNGLSCAASLEDAKKIESEIESGFPNGYAARVEAATNLMRKGTG